MATSGFAYRSWNWRVAIREGSSDGLASRTDGVWTTDTGEVLQLRKIG